MPPELTPNPQLQKIQTLLEKVLARLDKIESMLEKQKRAPALANPSRKQPGTR